MGSVLPVSSKFTITTMELKDKPIRVIQQSKFKNQLEKQLYGTDNVRDTKTESLSHPYERGMMISISNYKMSFADIRKEFKAQYESVVKCITGKSIRKGDLYEGTKIDKDLITKTIASNMPIMVAGIHDYRNDDRYGYVNYQHTHLYLYNIHRLYPDNLSEVIDMDNKLSRYFHRYTGNKKRNTSNIRITPVGNGVYKFTDIVKPNNICDYINSPTLSPDSNNLINYIANNRHNQKVKYPLTYVYPIY
tara:strand:- start:339 stop:1082 length:744 start_codon:yes stop_codon:yes gene_type:complete